MCCALLCFRCDVYVCCAVLYRAALYSAALHSSAVLCCVVPSLVVLCCAVVLTDPRYVSALDAVLVVVLAVFKSVSTAVSL